MTIGGAVTFDEILDPLFQAGKEIRKPSFPARNNPIVIPIPLTSCFFFFWSCLATGSCSCVGMVGATLGAGIGRYQGLHGLILDNLIFVRMVTAEGDIISVSAEENSDLFWGLRGAGMNFGIILSAKYRVYDLENDGNALIADLVFPPSANVSYFEILKTFQDVLPAPLSLLTLIDYNTTVGGVSSPVPQRKETCLLSTMVHQLTATMQAIIILNAVYVGPQDEGLALIKPFLDLNPIVQEIRTVPWNRVLTTAGFGLNAGFCIKGNIHSMFSLGIKNIDVATHTSVFEKMVQFYDDFPAARGSTLEIEFFPNQAVVAVPDSATAFPWRDVQANM